MALSRIKLVDLLFLLVDFQLFIVRFLELKPVDLMFSGIDAVSDTPAGFRRSLAFSEVSVLDSTYSWIGKVNGMPMSIRWIDRADPENSTEVHMMKLK